MSHVLIDERKLCWMMAALKGETHSVMLTLVPQADSSAFLVCALSQVTLVCCATTAPLPLVWERRIHAPSSQAVLLSRVLLTQALEFLSADRARSKDRTVSLQVMDHHLCFAWPPLVQKEHRASCQIPLANTVQDRAPVLVHLRSLREMARQFNGPAICLEQGDIRLRAPAGGPEERVAVGFVRLSKPADPSIQMMMALSEAVPSPAKEREHEACSRLRVPHPSR